MERFLFDKTHLVGVTVVLGPLGGLYENVPEKNNFKVSDRGSLDY